MDIYASEQEQVDAIRKWWRENWIALVLGVTLGLGGLFGYRYWQERVTTHAEAAADLYQQAIVALEKGLAVDIELARQRLQAEYDDTPYAALAALAEAKSKVEAGDPATARVLLEWVVAHADQPEVATIARLRLARVLLAGGDPAAGLAQLDGIDDQGFAVVVEELRGDIFRQQGEVGRALEAYRGAIAAGSDNRAVLQMKIDDLGVAPVEVKP